MAIIKGFTSLEQSKKLAEILPLESADMIYTTFYGKLTKSLPMPKEAYDIVNFSIPGDKCVPCWSLATLLEELNRNCWKVSLKCCGAEWDMTYDDGEIYISVPSDYAIDACYGLIIKLHERKLL